MLPLIEQLSREYPQTPSSTLAKVLFEGRWNNGHHTADSLMHLVRSRLGAQKRYSSNLRA